MSDQDEDAIEPGSVTVYGQQFSDPRGYITLRKNQRGYTWTIHVGADGATLDKLREAVDRATVIDHEMKERFEE
jgi:hypothetical protein